MAFVNPFACLSIVLAFAVAIAAAGTPTMTDEAARGVIDSVTPAVERLRGLKFKRKVPVEVVDDARLRAHALQRLEEFDYLDRLVTVGLVYELLGLVPRNADLLTILLDVMEEQTAGFYDPQTGAYYLLDDMPASTAAIFTAHELTHALEDQHFDLDRRMRAVLHDDDRLLAVTAVHEGSAMLVMNAFMLDAVRKGEVDPDALGRLAETEVGKAEKLAAMPPVLLRQLIGPYLLGESFLTAGGIAGAHKGYPADAVDRAIRHGPKSTEQILHPEKFWTRELRDDPVTVRISGVRKLLGRQWILRGEGVLGELTLGPLVGTSSPATAVDASSWTNEAAAGWDGDAWQLWVRGDETILLLATVWDSERDAREFAEALPSEPQLQWQVAGDRVAVVAGNAHDGTPLLLERLLRARAKRN